MIVESVQDEYGEFIKPMPFLIELKDIDSLINQSENEDKAAIKEVLTEHIGTRLGLLTRTNGIRFKEPHGNADLSLVRKVNSIIEILNIRITQMREAYFDNRRDGDIGAKYDFDSKQFCLYSKSATQNYTPTPKESESANTEHSDLQPKIITNYQALISTRKLLKAIGGNLYYDGPIFKFESNRHHSPADAYLGTLAKQYMMQVVIPNVLLAKKFGWFIVGRSAIEALDYCMTTGKCQRAKDSWERFKNDDKMMTPIKDIYKAPVWWWGIIRWILLALALAGAAAGGVWAWKKWGYLLRKDKNEPVPQELLRPAEEVALEKLDNIRERKIWQNGQVKEYHTELTDVVREYIGRRFEVRSTEKTSDETLRAMKPLLEEQKELYTGLARMLQLADLVKFAKWSATPDENEGCLHTAYMFVRETTPAEAPEDTSIENTTDTK